MIKIQKKGLFSIVIALRIHVNVAINKKTIILNKYNIHSIANNKCVKVPSYH